MKFKTELSGITLPPTYIRNNKECFLDPYRKRLIEITPEEIVRQRIARFYETVLGVPKESISLEVPMSHYAKGTKGRADIIIHDPDAEFPLAVIECKKSDILLTDNVYEQAMKYSNIVLSDYYIITNGIDIEIAKYDESEDVYRLLDNILTYQEMKCGNGIEKTFDNPCTRFSLDELNDMEKLTEYNNSSFWIFGEDTPDHLRSFSTNFFQALMDIEHCLPQKDFKNFRILEDLGIRFMDYSNGGAGHYIGDYRSFLIEDKNKNCQIISFGLFGTTKELASDKGQKRNSYTTFNIAIDKYKVSHNILQYNIDKYVSIGGKELSFLHDGRISSKSSEELRNYVSQNSELLSLTNGRLNLGTLYTNQLLYLDAEDVSQLIYRFIEYALIREEFRHQNK